MCVYMYMYMYIGANRMRMPCPSFSRRDCRAAHLSSACFKHRAPRHCAADPPQATAHRRQWPARVTVNPCRPFRARMADGVFPMNSSTPEKPH